jgi:penicillin-binding protein 1C
MQIARMMEPKPRTLPGKIVEIFRAFQLELRFSKSELLEIYFNLVPYGGNIEGIGAASYLYFDKTPERLSLSEIAMLTAIPTSPSKFRPDHDQSKCIARRNLILATLNQRGIITGDQMRQAMLEEVPLRRTAPVETAPHFCQSLIANHPHRVEIHSTLDYKLQKTCERLAYSHYQKLSLQGIWNLSVVVIDNHKSQLLAMVGSPDFSDILHHGQVNGALARRSPGSALKPFVYALGFEKGFSSPARKVDDLPVNYSGYVPVNYDEKYHGLVSVREALIQSLNVPAVNLTAEVGLSSFYDLLNQGGISTLDRRY